MDHSFDDIINLPHHVSDVRTPMSRAARAAQFAPFAALTGYSDAIAEAGRTTCERPELEEESNAILNRKLAWVRDRLGQRPVVTFTCFVPDGRKQGGHYCAITGIVRTIDDFEATVVLADGRKISIESILDIEGVDDE